MTMYWPILFVVVFVFVSCSLTLTYMHILYVTDMRAIPLGGQDKVGPPDDEPSKGN